MAPVPPPTSELDAMSPMAQAMFSNVFIQVLFCGLLKFGINFLACIGIF